MTVHVIEDGKRPVMNLTKEDFQIYEKGEIQEITFFEEFDLRSDIKEMSNSPSEEFSEEFDSDPSGIVQQTVLFIDSGFMARPSFDRLIRDLCTFIEQSDLQRTRFKIIHLDQTMSQLTPFTSSKKALIRALRNIQYRGEMRRTIKSLNHAILGTQNRKMREAGSGKALYFRPEITELARARLEQKGKVVRAYYKAVLQCLIGSAHMLKPLPGQKNIYSFSGGGYRSNNSDLGDPALEDLVNYFSKMLNGHGITLHNFFSDDGRPLPFEANEFDRLQELVSLGHKFNAKSKRDFTELKPLSNFVSLQTGGFSRLIKGKNACIEAVSNVQRLTQTGYTISYTLAGKRRPGKISIKLRNKKNNWKLIYGKEYPKADDDTPYQEDQEMLTLEGDLIFGRLSDFIPLSWTGNIFKVKRDSFITVIQGELSDLSFLDTQFEIAAAAINDCDEPLGHIAWEIQRSHFDSNNHFSILINTPKPPDRIRLLVQNPKDGTRYLGQCEGKFCPESQLSPVLFLDGKNSDPFLNKSVQPFLNTSHVNKNPFTFEMSELNPLNQMKPNVDVMSLVYVYDYQALGPSFSVDLEIQSGDTKEKIQTEIIQIRKMGANTLEILCLHKIREIVPNSTLTLCVSGETGLSLVSPILF